MTQRQRIIDQINHKTTDFVPTAKLEFEGDVAERLDVHYGSTRWRDLVEEYDHILRVGCVNRDGLSVSDRSDYYTDVYGNKWRADRRPLHLVENALTEPSLEGFTFPVASDFLYPDWRDRLERARAEHPDKFIVTGLGFGMFVRSWTLRGFMDALSDTASEPEFYEELIEKICELHLSILDQLVTGPVDGCMFDGDWGDQRGILMGPERWRRFIKPRLARLYERVHREGKTTLHHSCGNVRDVIPDLIEIGLDVLQSVQPEAMNPYELKREFGADITFWGGLGSQRTVPFGTPREIREEINRLCTVMAEGGGYILGPAKALQTETPTENAAAVVESFLSTVGVEIGPSGR